MKNVIVFAHNSPLFLLRDGHGNLNIMEIGPECFLDINTGEIYRRNIFNKAIQEKQYSQQDSP